MILNNSIRSKLEELKGSVVIDAIPLSGGCISNAFKITFADKDINLLKINVPDMGDMFIKEGHGLQELKKARAIRVPEVICCDTEFILLEFLNSAPKKKNFFEEFGRKFALLHKYTSNEFGFYENNYIGSTIQINLTNEATRLDWVNFYFNNNELGLTASLPDWNEAGTLIFQATGSGSSTLRPAIWHRKPSKQPLKSFGSNEIEQNRQLKSN